MRSHHFLPVLLLLCGGFVSAQDDDVPKTEKLKDSVREWIETMREVQRTEDAWERDRVVLEDQRAALESEIADLTGRVESAKLEKQGADKESTDLEAERDAYLKSRELLAAEVRSLETAMVAKLPSFPPPLAGEPKVKELMDLVRQDAKLEGEEAAKGLSKRLNNVLNLLTEAEKWQQTVHLRDELHQMEGGPKINMKVVYFGLAAAYAVEPTLNDQPGKFALVGKPGANGWSFEPRHELAADISRMVDVLNGDTDAQFVELPIELK
jgi:hypothetical protein